MTSKLKTYIDNPENVQEVFREVDIKFISNQGVERETLLVYLQCTNGKCDHSEMFRLIKDNIMHNFALSFSEIERKLDLDNYDESRDELFRKAVRKLSVHTAKGELGELLLFTLLDVYFEAPKILSKISLKTSRRMPVYGADAVHAQYVDGKLRLYLGESKLHKNFGSASTSAVKSIANCLDKYTDEFDLIDSYVDFPEMDDQAREDLITLLDPFSSVDPDTLHTPCFIGFVNPDIFSDDEEQYIQKYIRVGKQHVEDFYSQLGNEGGDVNKTALFLLPFTSFESLVDEFIEYMGIEK
ncbi:MAG: hypothetical protein ACJA2O_004544 [Candidatus Azotimanducaceae bacterium]|jgi:hypothetical protein